MYAPIPQMSPYRYVLSGHGDVSSEKCGEYKFTLACVGRDDRHKHKSKRHARTNCKSPLCPKCFRTVAGRKAKSIEQRMSSLTDAYKARHIKVGKPKHIAFSVWPWLYSKDFLELDAGKFFYERVIELLDLYMKDGYYAGVLIPHNERKKHDDDGSECDFEAYYEYGKLITCPRDHHWEWGPHFHYIGYGFFDIESREFYEKTNWRYYNIPSPDGRSISATAFYLLTHSANYVKVDTGRLTKSYKYVGLFSDKVAKKDKDKEIMELCLCGLDGCECPLHKFKPALDRNLRFVEDPYLECDDGEFYMKRKVECWKLKQKAKQSNL